MKRHTPYLVALLSLTVLTITAPLCHARLGESETKCDVRYNPEGKKKVEPSGEDKRNPLNVGVPLDTVTYTYEGWNIRIGFKDGFARCMEYRKANGERPDGAEIEAILKANELGGTWQSVSLAQSKTNAPLAELWKYTGGTQYSGGYWLRSDGSVAYLTGSGFGSTLRLVHKKAVHIGLRQMRDAATANKKPVPKF